MRIAFAMINCNRRDGSARAVNEVAERLARRHEVHLFARTVEDLDLARVQWHQQPGPGWPEVVDFSSFYLGASRALRRQRFDLVHSIGCNVSRADVITIQNIQPAKQVALARIGQPDPVSFPRRLTRWLYRQTTSAAEKRLYTQRTGRRPPLFLPVSRGVEAELRAHYEIGSASVKIIPNAADVKLFKPLPPEERQRWREEHGIFPEEVLLIFSGGEWVRKGLDLAIKGLERAACSNTKLFVAGDDPDRSRFQRLAVECGLAHRVIFGGFRQDIAVALASADLFLFPSWYEAFSLATIEAAACALPIIATRINGTEDFVQPGVTGEFIEHDPAHIGSAIQKMVDQPDLRRSMGRNGRRLVEEKYTWERVAAMTEQAYGDYLTQKPKHP